MNMRVADYIFHFLADAGARHVFLVTGGGAMFLNDGLRCEPRLMPVCQHHEQACTIAAEGYARITGKPGVACVTTGPGGVNALNGVYGAWTDSIPMLVVSGQIKREMCMASYPSIRLRQLGDQEADVISMAKTVTKYAVLVDDPRLVRYHLERAWHLAASGRPGPCWLDVPLDVQASMIDPDNLPGYDPAEDAPTWDRAAMTADCYEIIERLRNTERPVILAGGGIRCAGAVEAFRVLVRRLGIPVVASRAACDILPYYDPLYAGRSGIDADRAGNFVVQASDFLLILGSRLGPRQTGYDWAGYAPNAHKIWVNVDAEEFAKPAIPVDRTVHADVAVVITQLDARSCDLAMPISVNPDWVAWCRERVHHYTRFIPQRPECDALNPYRFFGAVFDTLADDDVIACGNGAAFIMAAQMAALRPNQRLFFNSGCASMGYDLPAAIGAAFAHGRRVICFAGDGSLMMNLQELQTVAHHQLPIKLFIINNDGYLSIRTTQTSYFSGFIGESPASGVSFPDFCRLAAAFGLPTHRITAENMGDTLGDILAAPGPAVIDVVVDRAQSFEPRLCSRVLPDGRMVSASLEDMYPFLDAEELAENRWDAVRV